MRELSGKTVLLTGAASGIGRELALQLADEGCHLLLVDVDQKRLQEVANRVNSRGIDVHTYRCDLADKHDIARTITAAIHDTDVIDILINNAGVAYYGPTERMTQEQWDWLMSVNLLAPIRITQQLLPHLLERPDAHIVNMCSISGLVAGGRFAAYQTSKFGLIGFTESLRVEFGRSGLGVTAICSGPVRTRLYESAASPDTARKMPLPPAIICASTQRVAKLTLKAIRRNRRMALITPMAHGLFQIKRFFPGLLDAVSGFSRKKRRRRQERLLREEQRLAALQQRVLASEESPNRAA